MHAVLLPDSTIAALTLTRPMDDSSLLESIVGGFADSPFLWFAEELRGESEPLSWLEDRLGICWPELVDVVSGKLTLGYVQWQLPPGLPAKLAPANPPPPAWLLLADVRGSEAPTEALLKSIGERLRAGGYVNRGIHKDFKELNHFDLRPNSVSKSDPILRTSKRIYCVREGLLFATHDLEVAKKVLQLSRGERSDCVANNPACLKLLDSIGVSANDVLAECYLQSTPDQQSPEGVNVDSATYGVVVGTPEAFGLKWASVESKSDGDAPKRATQFPQIGTVENDTPKRSMQTRRYPGLFVREIPHGLRRPTREHPVLGHLECIRYETMHFWQAIVNWTEEWKISFEINDGPNAVAEVFDAAGDFLAWAREFEPEVRRSIVDALTKGRYRGMKRDSQSPLFCRGAEAYVRQLALRRLDYAAGGSSEWHFDCLEPMLDTIGLRQGLNSQHEPDYTPCFVAMNPRERAKGCLERIIPSDAGFGGSLAEQLLYTYDRCRLKPTSEVQLHFNFAIADAEREATIGGRQRRFFFREVVQALEAVRQELLDQR